jgi:hypothetical protein
MDNQTSEARICRQCGLAKEPGEFRRRRRASDRRMWQCRRCHNELERYRRAAIRAGLSRRRMGKDLARFREAAASNQVRALCAAMVGGYGGPEGFAAAWLRCLQQDLERGGLAALRHLEATLRLVQYCEQDRPDYGQLTDEELESLISKASCHKK